MTVQTVYIKQIRWSSMEMSQFDRLRLVSYWNGTLCADFFQVTLPKEIPPSLKTSCVRYLYSFHFLVNPSHLLSLCFSDKIGVPHFLSIPITVLTYPSLFFPIRSFTHSFILQRGSRVYLLYYLTPHRYKFIQWRFHWGWNLMSVSSTGISIQIVCYCYWRCSRTSQRFRNFKSARVQEPRQVRCTGGYTRRNLV